MKFKKVLIGLLAVVTVLTSIPMPLEQVDAADSSEIYETVAQQVKVYASSIAQEGADQQAMSDLLNHSIKKAGQELYMDESDATTVSLLNSNLLQESLSYTIAGTIERMQKFQKDFMYSGGDVSWYTHKSTYTIYSYLSEEMLLSERYGTVASSKSIHGTDGFPTDNFNDNDKAMVLIVGGSRVRCAIKEVETRKNTKLYDIKLRIYDDFDFDGNYEASKELGYDTSAAELITQLGAWLLNEFYWETEISFQVEAPYQCDHNSGSYHWTMNEGGESLTNVSNESFAENAATALPYTSTSTGITYYYYELAEPVKLLHDKPWVVEYAGKKIIYCALSPFTTSSSTVPFFFHYSTSYALFMDYEQQKLTTEESAILKENPKAEIARSINHYSGLATTGIFNKYYSKNTLRFRLENVIEGNSNMVYFSIYNEDTGEELLAPTPMDDYYEKKSYETTRTLIDEESDWLRGKDFYINYIGNKSYPLRAEAFELSIWESGKEFPSQSAFEVTSETGTCVQAGTRTSTCAECNYAISESTGFTDHQYGQFKLNYDTTCTKDGTETAVCKVCGEEKTQIIEGSAKGHVEKAVKGYAATCAEAGRTDGVICAECDAVIEGYEIIPALEHTYGAYVSDNNAKCNEDGTKTATCTECEDKKVVADEGTALKHVEKKLEGYAAECMKPGLTDGSVCALCDKVLEEQKSIPALEHVYGEFQSNNDATCQADGTKTRVCELCDGKETVEDKGSKKLHDEVSVKGYAATCTKAGLTDGIVCKNCQTPIEEQKEIKAYGHKCESYVSNNDAVCGTDGTKTGECIVCHEMDTIVDIGSGQAHTEKVIEGYAATCAKEGLSDGIVCTGCGATVQEQKPIEKMAHTEKVTQGYAATCTKDGLTEGRVCTVCNEVLAEQKTVKALGHMFGEYVSNNDATTTSDGTKTATCLACGEKNTVKDAGTMKEPVNNDTSNKYPVSGDKAPTTGNSGFGKILIWMWGSVLLILFVWKKREAI